MGQAESIVRIEDGRKRTEKEKKIILSRWFNPAKCFDVSRETQRKRLYIIYSDRASEWKSARDHIILYTPKPYTQDDKPCTGLLSSGHS